jgi:hypothetical protein
MTRILLAVFTFAAFVGLSLATLSAGDLKQNIYAQKLAAQKLTQQVDDAIERSKKQDPTDAKFALNDMIRRVTDSNDLEIKERATQLQRLQARLNGVQEIARAKQVKDEQTPPRDRPRYDRPPAGDPGKGGYGAAKDFIGSAKGAAQANNDVIRQREAGLLAQNKDLVPLKADREINFPQNWKEIKERREKMVNPQLTEKEVALLKALNSSLTVNYKEEKLSAVISHLMERTGLTIIADPASLQDAMVDYEADTVTLQFPKMQVRTALKKILGDKGLTYIIKEGNIMIMTPKKASEYTVMRTYQVDDLVQVDPQIQRMFGPFVAQAQRIQNAQMLINLIQSMTDGSYWAPNGPGTISFYPPTNTLVIRASAEMHYQLGSPGSFFGR